MPRSRASRSGAWPGEEQGGRSTSASAGSSAAQIAAHSSAPCTSPEGEETATSASSSRSARARDLRRLALHPRSIVRVTLECTGCPSCRRWRSSRGGSTRRCRARRSSPRSRPGINALKTFDPPLHALEGRAFTGVRRRGKLLVLELGELVVLVHLMSAGRLQLQPEARARCATRRRGCCCGCPGTASCACASSAPSRRRG